MLVPAVMLSYRDLKKEYKRVESSVYNDIHNKLSKIVDYKWSNTHTYLTDECGIPFVFCLYGGSLTVYGNTGSEHLFNWNLKYTNEDWEAFELMFKLTAELYNQGVGLCSVCGKPMMKDKNDKRCVHLNFEYIKVPRYYAGFHFAGKICNECYTEEVKRAAESESYN